MGAKRLMVVSAVALMVGVVAVSTSFAQPPAPQPAAPSKPGGQAPNILLQLTPPSDAAPTPNGSLTRDELDYVPPPRPDRLFENARITVTVGDPRCLPGEDDDWVYLPGGRRHHRH